VCVRALIPLALRDAGFSGCRNHVSRNDEACSQALAMQHSNDTRLADRAEATRIQPTSGRILEPWPPSGPMPVPQRYTAATVHAIPRQSDDHVFDPTW
jgi:hypothetical protein